jgi:hypothetical protein
MILSKFVRTGQAEKFAWLRLESNPKKARQSAVEIDLVAQLAEP